MLIKSLRRRSYTQLTCSFIAFLNCGGLAFHLSCQEYVNDIQRRLLPLQDSMLEPSRLVRSSSFNSLSSPETTAIHTPRHAAARGAYSVGDDTLPSPPAMRAFYMSTLTDPVAHSTLSVALSDEQPPAEWTLHERRPDEEVSVNEGEVPVKTVVRRNLYSGQGAATTYKCQETVDTSSVAEEGALLYSREHAVLPHIPSAEWPAAAKSESFNDKKTSVELGRTPHETSQPPAVVAHAAGSHEASSSTPSTTKDTTNSEGDSDDDESLPLIEIPLPPALRNSASRALSEPPAELKEMPSGETEPPSATARRTKVLVSPAMVDDSPDTTNSWMSPGRVGGSSASPNNHHHDYYQSLSSTEQEEARGSRGVSYTRNSTHAAETRPAEARNGSESQTARSAPLTSPSPTRPAAPSSSPPPQSVSPSRDFSSHKTTDVAQEETHSTPAPPPPPLQTSPPRQQSAARLSESVNEVTSPAARSALQRLRLQLNQAERAAALQHALCETAVREKEDAQVQLEELLHIQSELERRSQEHEAALTAATQRHTAEKLAWELEGQTELTALKATHEEKLQQWETLRRSMQAQAAAASKESLAVQTELAEAREKLRAALEAQLKDQQQLLEVKHALTAAVQSCSSLQKELKQLQEARRAAEQEHTREVKRLEDVLQESTQRSAVSQLAFRTLCDQLTCVLERPPYFFTSCDVSALSVSGAAALPSEGDTNDNTKILNCSTATQFSHEVWQTLQAVMTEDALIDVVQSLTVEQHSCLQGSFVSCTQGTNTSKYGAAAKGIVASSEKNGSGRPDAQKDVLKVEELSASCKALLQQHRQEVRSALTAVVERCRRVTRETQAFADARSAEMERALSAELQQLRLQVAELKQQPAETHLKASERQDAAVGVTPRGPDTTSDFSRSKFVTSPSSATYNATVNDNGLAADARARSVSPPPSEVQTLQMALTEAKRALLLEQHHTTLLRREVESLQATRSNAGLLAAVEGSVLDAQNSIARRIVEAVEDMQRTEVAEGLSVPYHNNSFEKGHWTRMGKVTLGDRHTPNPPPSNGVSELFHDTAGASLDNRALLRSVHKAVLLAEAQVERVGEELLGETRRERFVDAASALAATQASPRLTARKTVDYAAAPASVSPHAERQQRVYQQMQGLLQRAQLEGEESGFAQQHNSTSTKHHGYHHQSDSGSDSRDTVQKANCQGASSPIVSRYSPDGSRWLAGIRPPPGLPSQGLPPPPPSAMPSGAVVTPTRLPSASATSLNTPSPYVQAYVRAAVEDTRPSNAPSILNRSSAFAVQRQRNSNSSDTNSGNTCTGATALRLFEVMMTTTQELRTVGSLLEAMRDNEETHAMQRQARLQHWEERIKATVREELRRVQAAVTALRPPNVALELFQRQRQDRRAGDVNEVCIPPHPTTGEDAADTEERPPQPHVRLSDVLSGKQPPAAAALTGAVCYSHSE